MSKQNIPVFLPKLPITDALVPYLKKIDANRWYSNFGPLHETFLERFAALFKTQTSRIVLGSSGTQLLELCLRAMDVKPGSLCLMPSWTFVATPLAALSAHLEPVFVDVDRKTQSLNPDQLLNKLPSLSKLGHIGAVIVVAPFGSPIDTEAWDKFTELTKIPVIIDAAAAFDTILQSPQMQIRNTPMMVSLHTTKIFGVGEGGAIFSTNKKIIQHIENLTHFGFVRGERNSYFRGTNVKMSEYVCAVGLAGLDLWSSTRSAWQEATSYYLKALEKTNIAHMLSGEWVSNTCNIHVPNQADVVLTELAARGIMARKWWGNGCHHHPILRSTRIESDLNNTEYLQKSILGLPFYMDITQETINHIVESVIEISQKTESPLVC